MSSNERNQEILRRLKENDPSLGTMWIRNEVYDRDSGVYCPGDDVDELGWLQDIILGEKRVCRNSFSSEMTSTTHLSTEG